MSLVVLNLLCGYKTETTKSIGGGVGVGWPGCGPFGARCFSLRQTQPWFTLKSGTDKSPADIVFLACASAMVIDSFSPPPYSPGQPCWLFCQLQPACAWWGWSLLLHTAGARLAWPNCYLADMLPLSLGRPFQSTNNTGEFRLIGSASLRQRGKKGFLKVKGLRRKVSKVVST